MVVLLGGWPEPTSDGTTNSVRLLNVCEKRWQTGPPLQEKRKYLASVVCNGVVYVIGGHNGQTVGDLLHSSSSSFRNNFTGWKTLNCCLTSKRYECAAVAVSDRFIMVAGGRNHSDDNCSSSVDILDTASGNPYSVVSGPSLKKGRSDFVMAVVGSRIYAVGGSVGKFPYARSLESVEYLEFDDWLDPVTSTSPLSTKSWTIHKELILNKPRSELSAVQVGSCLVVAGGGDASGKCVRSVEVLDTVRNMVWELPGLSSMKSFCGMISSSNAIAVITRNDALEFSFETLSLVDKKSWLFALLLEIGKVPTSPGSSYGSSTIRSC